MQVETHWLHLIAGIHILIDNVTDVSRTIVPRPLTKTSRITFSTNCSQDTIIWSKNQTIEEDQCIIILRKIKRPADCCKLEIALCPYDT